MAEKADNPYAQLYGKPAHTVHNSTTPPSQPRLYTSSQPLLQHLAQPYHCQLQPQSISGPHSSGHVQHVPSADASMTHPPAGSSAPRWQPAAPAQRGLPGHDSIAHLACGDPAHPWLPPGQPPQQLSLRQSHAAPHASADGHTTLSPPATLDSHRPPDAQGEPETLSVSQTNEAGQSGRAAEELPNKRQRIDIHSSHCHHSSSETHGTAKQNHEPGADAVSAPGVERAGGQGKATVLIWDMDETLVLFLSLLDGSFAQGFGMQHRKVAEQLGERWQDAIIDLCDDELLFTQLEAADQTTLTSLLAYDDGAPLDELSLPVQPVSMPLDDVSRRQLAHAYRLIRHTYGKGLSKLSERGSWPEKVTSLRQLVRETDAISGNWLSHAKQLLHDCQSAELHVHHVVVTTGQLIPTLAKLLICGLDAYVPADGIYSARNETKDHCFRLIQDGFGPHTDFCVIGDGPEERRCAEVRDWPFVQVSLSAGKETKAACASRRLTDITAQGVLNKIRRQGIAECMG